MAQGITTKVMPGAPSVSGYIQYAPKGIALPTDATTAPVAGWVKIGYVSSEGVKPEETTKVEDERDWNDDIVLTMDGESTIKRAFTLISTLDFDVNVFLFGAANVSKTAATTTASEKLVIARDGEGIDECQLLIDMKFGKRLRREVFPSVKPVLTGRTEYTKSKAMGYQVEVTAHKDSNGKFLYEYLDDGVKA